MTIVHTNHDSLNTLLTQLDAQYKREKALRSVIDSLFIFICQRCTEDEISTLSCLEELRKLASEKQIGE